MKKWALFLALACLAGSARAAKVLSVEQLEQWLAANRGKSDAHIAQQLSQMDLSERVSPVRLARWEKTVTGSKTREELMRLADSGAFLKQPAEDILRDPPPDTERQKKMIELAVDYVKETGSRLPNFYATRTTTHFGDTPIRDEIPVPGATPKAQFMPLSSVAAAPAAKRLQRSDTFSATVTYRDGAEVHDTTGRGAAEVPSTTGMTTYGEFGPILTIVLDDAVQGQQLTWSHWEMGEENEPVAVFHYEVPENESHYSVGIQNVTNVETVIPGYQGEISIDPATGSIMRLTAVGVNIPTTKITEAAILVEYATVTLGNRNYICPVHGVARSKMPIAVLPQQSRGSSAAVQTHLNDISFTGYHLFRSEARMVSGADTPSSTTAQPSEK